MKSRRFNFFKVGGCSIITRAQISQNSVATYTVPFTIVTCTVSQEPVFLVNIKRQRSSALRSLARLSWRNMSRHALMGRTAARLETMILVFSSYVLVFVICKSQ